MSYIWLCVAGLLVEAAFIALERRRAYSMAVIIKGLASAIFVMLGVLGMRMASDKGFALWIVLGLIMGMGGDICLNLRYVFKKQGKMIFMVGIALFMLGQILYLAALMPIAPHTLVYSLPAGLVAAALLLIWLLRQIEVGGALKIFGSVYIAVVALMAAVATGLFINAPGEKGLLLFMIGALLFAASDVVLVLNQFGKRKGKTLRTVNLSLYYVGQLLIALSLQLF